MILKMGFKKKNRKEEGQGEFSVGLALTHPRCRVTTNNVALKKAARS
jgi:hypothetical protein